MKEKTKMAYHKVLNTIKSCKTNEQIGVAIHFINMFIRQFKNDISMNDVEMIASTLVSQKIGGIDNVFSAQVIKTYFRYSGSKKTNSNLFKVFKFEDYIVNRPYQIK